MKGEIVMGWFFSLFFFVTTMVTHEPLYSIAAGVFAISGSIGFKQMYLKIKTNEDKVENRKH